MYCRMCGNLLGDTDHYCKVCGAPTGYKEPSAAPSETTEIKEEIVFNPPYENKSHFFEGKPRFAEEEPPAPEKEEEALKEFISENEIEEHKKQEEDTVNSESEKNNEFTWNVHEFPTTKKTEDITFNWTMEDYGPPEQKDAQTVAFEEQLFQEIRDDSNRIKESNIDRFFTFSKKNEEFQELLDKEYEKFKMRSEPITDYIAYKAASEQIAAKAEKITEAPESKEPQEIAKAPEEDEPAVIDIPDSEITEETIPTEEITEETIPTVEITEETVPEAVAAGVAPKAEHISEMTQARAQFFGAELIKDNETIKKKLASAEPVAENIESVAENIEPEEEDVAPAAENLAPATEETFEAAEQFTEDMKAEPPEEDKKEDGKHKRNVGQILLIIIAIILAAEIAILGIRYFAPNSAAAEAIDNTQTQIYNTVSGWMDGINDMFSGKDSNEAVAPADNEKDTAKDNTKQEEQPAVEEPTDTESNVSAPDPNPAIDKNALISSQMGNNINIQQVKANSVLTYQAGKNYGLADINNSKPITNNIWQTPENGDPVYYDKSIVGTIIAFDSQWIDYVNGGSKNVLDLLKKDSKAYQNAASYSKIGKIKETFKLLEIGEIRQGSKGFYVWVHEELQLTENGTTAEKKYNWIYYLEPVDGKMQIVNYFKF